jgi:hypothetical protein
MESSAKRSRLTSGSFDVLDPARIAARLGERCGGAWRHGGPIDVIRPGDCVFFDPDEDHWHRAIPVRFMMHLAMQQGDNKGSAVTWATTSPTRSTTLRLRSEGLNAAGLAG